MEFAISMIYESIEHIKSKPSSFFMTRSYEEMNLDGLHAITAVNRSFFVLLFEHMLCGLEKRKMKEERN